MVTVKLNVWPNEERIVTLPMLPEKGDRIAWSFNEFGRDATREVIVIKRVFTDGNPMITLYCE